MIFSNRQNYSDGEQVGGCRGLAMERCDPEGAAGGGFWNESILHPAWGGVEGSQEPGHMFKFLEGPTSPKFNATV